MKSQKKALNRGNWIQPWIFVSLVHYVTLSKSFGNYEKPYYRQRCTVATGTRQNEDAASESYGYKRDLLLLFEVKHEVRVVGVTSQKKVLKYFCWEISKSRIAKN